MIDTEFLNKLALNYHKANPDYDSQKLHEEVVSQYCITKALTNIPKVESEILPHN